MSRMLAEAFYDDPAQRWLFPDDSKRLDQATRFFETVSGMPMGQQAWTTAGVAAGAVWFEPGSWPIGAVAAARQAPLLLKVLGRRAPLVLAGLASVERSHPRAPSHWYLANIGTHPGHRRKGIATRLLGAVLERADRDGIAVFLEAPSAAVVDFFSPFGFVVSGDVRIPFGPRLYQMWRDPES
jgi:ribosomal protein S18 acetylase RimI-like enzyme